MQNASKSSMEVGTQSIRDFGRRHSRRDKSIPPYHSFLFYLTQKYANIHVFNSVLNNSEKQDLSMAMTKSSYF